MSIGARRLAYSVCSSATGGEGRRSAVRLVQCRIYGRPCCLSRRDNVVEEKELPSAASPAAFFSLGAFLSTIIYHVAVIGRRRCASSKLSP